MILKSKWSNNIEHLDQLTSVIRALRPAMFRQARRSCLSSTLRGMLRRQSRMGLMKTLGSRRRAAFVRATASRIAASLGVNSSAARVPGRITKVARDEQSGVH